MADNTATFKGNVKSRTDQAKIVWYKWNQELGDTDDIVSSGLGLAQNLAAGLASKFNVGANTLAESTAYDISAHITDVTFTKSLADGAGSFSITLDNAVDWNKFLKPGEWVTIYMSSEGNLAPANASGGGITKNLPGGLNKIGGILTPSPSIDLPAPNIDLPKASKYLRGLCLIQRVAVSSSIDGDGAADVTYVVTGKDFGVCMEETELWFNFLFFQNKLFQSMATQGLGVGSRALHQLLGTWFDAFFKPEQLFSSVKGFASPNDLADNLKQWLMPSQMLKDINTSFDKESYFGNIERLKEFNETLFENNLANPLVGLEGAAWSKLKGLSQPEYHEFFTELSDSGKPKVFFRPIPWAIKKEKYPNIGKYVMSYQDLVDSNTPGLASKVADVIGKATSLASSAISTVSSLTGGAVGGNLGIIDKSEFRTNHRINLSSRDVYSYDIGPDFHSRYNHFLIDANSQSAKQQSAVHALSTQKQVNFPFRNDLSIKRHGFKPRHFVINSFLNNQGAGLTGEFSDNPGLQFIFEANRVQQDYWGQAGDFYSGTFVIDGMNSTKLGKVIVTDSTVEGVQNMVFYIESYVDRFTVDADGNGEWIQTLTVTRGIELSDLAKKSGFKQTEASQKVGSFVSNGGPKK